MGVLQRIALCYFAASLIFLAFKTKAQLFATAFFLVFYWMLMALVPVPGYGIGVLTQEGNLAGYVDSFLLRGHLYQANFDPEGLLSTIPAIATTLIGVLAGQLLRSNREALEKTVNLFFFGSLCVALGFLWDLWFPINKNLWTSSFAVFTGGMALVSLAVAYYVIDVKKHIVWSKPFTIFGTNAIAVYVLSGFVNLALIYTSVTQSNGMISSLKEFIYRDYFASWAGALNGALLYAFAYVMVWLGVMAILYKRRIFLKV
jgi:predicted acyltransferase